jgi:hypothetical protein
LWLEYRIPADLEREKQMIRQMRTWIEKIEQQGLIRGFAFDHYFGRADARDELRVRFDYPNEENSTVRDGLRDAVRPLAPDYSPQGRAWESNEEVLKAYEFGSRCAFLLWEKIDQGRYPEDYLSDFAAIQNGQNALHRIPFNFQFHFNHGVMNSLGVPKIPNEQWIHLLALIESTRSHNFEELCSWIRRQPSGFFRLFE